MTLNYLVNFLSTCVVEIREKNKYFFTFSTYTKDDKNPFT